MKLLCEVPLPEVKAFQESHFNWLAKSSTDNFLFTFENRKRMRVFAIKNKNALHNDKQAARAHEAQSASLAEPRQCTSSSWNRDESLLALVVDRRQIYLWQVHRNTFVQFKPNYLIQEQQFGAGDEVPVGGRRRGSGKYIDHIAWSKTSDKLSICFSDAQILLCNVVCNQERNYVSSWERLIGNSEGLLKRISSIHVSDHADLFVCSSISNELLVMAFDGANRLYCQAEGEGHRPYNMKFSPPIREFDARSGSYCEHRFWLGHQSELDSGLILRNVSLKSASSQAQEDVAASRLRVLIQDSNSRSDESTNRTLGSLVDFYWLNSARLIACLSNGSIQVLNIKNTSQTLATLSDATFTPTRMHVTNREVLRLSWTESVDESEQQIGNGDSALKAFELVRSGRKQESSDHRRSFAFAAITSYRLYYYEIYESREIIEDEDEFVFEHFDDLDLSEPLVKVNLKFERIKWSQDCSMLSVQLSSGHLLIYQTQLLHDHMVASHGAKTAYLSSPGEITLLNYGSEDASKLSPTEVESFDGRRNSAASSRTSTPLSGNAIILSLQFKPSLLAIGPSHLAVALNNRIRFYTIETILRLNNQITSDNQKSIRQKSQREFAEQEYVTLVVGIGLSSRFVASMLDDGRVKLHSLNEVRGEPRNVSIEQGSPVSDDEPTDTGPIDDERFFPDPSQTTQRISAFTLTEELLVYCTSDYQIYVFSVKLWQTVQTYNHSGLFKAPIVRLKPNDRGNKFICLIEIARQQPNSVGYSSDLDDTDANAYLYDLFSNRLFNLDCNQSQLANQLSHKLVVRLVDKLPPELFGSVTIPKNDKRTPTLSCIQDVVWDTDGRSILFIQTNSIHVLAILEHTLEQEEPLAIYADRAKPASHSTLYVSEGIVSYQTSLGRVINSILETHDDELKLTRLEHRIKLVNDQYAIKASEGNSIDSLPYEGHLKVVILKLKYLRSILPIYSLLKCRDICDHLMEEQAFRFGSQLSSVGKMDTWIGQVDQLIWRLLAGWAVFTLNLNFAHQIFQQHGLDDEAALLSALFEDMKATGLDSRSAINEKLFTLLELL